jgi:hypothetical protein
MGLPRPTRQPHRLADDGFLAYLPAAMGIAGYAPIRIGR